MLLTMGDSAGDLVTSLVDRGTLAVLAGCALLAVGGVFARHRWPGRVTTGTIWLITTILAVLAITQLPAQGFAAIKNIPWANAHRRLINWPFQSDLTAGWATPGWWLNVALFVPVGTVLAAHTNPRHHRALLAASGLSVAVESLQAVTQLRSADLVDIAANTFGAACGVALWTVAIRQTAQRWSRASLARRRILTASTPLLAICAVGGFVLADTHRAHESLRIELRHEFSDTTLVDMHHVFFPDNTELDDNFDDFLARTSIRPDGLVRGPDQTFVRARYTIRSFGLYKCVYVTWSTTNVRFTNGTGDDCTKFIDG